jgi:hypothetical protein
MPRFEDYRADSEVYDIMRQFVDKLPMVFYDFQIEDINFIMTQKKKSKVPMKLRTTGYPMEVYIGKPYIVEIFEDVWCQMTPKKKNLAVFHTMCAFPDGAFDPASKFYGKKVKPQIMMYDLEYAASGGVTNWMENDMAVDPMEMEPSKIASNIPKTTEIEDDDDALPLEPKRPVTQAGIASVGTE